MRSRFSMPVLALLLAAPCALAQSLASVDWSMLPDPEAQRFEDPYRDLTKPQFQSLMMLARLRMDLDTELAASERADLKAHALELKLNLQSQGLDPEWILDQRETVAARRQHAAIATNPELDGETIELSGYLLVAPDMESGELVAYLLPDRGVCMHLPPPAPNQLLLLDIDELPEPLGPCIAAAVRGRISANETTVTVPVFDDTVPLWTSWQLDVSEVSTSENLSARDSSRNERH